MNTTAELSILIVEDHPLQQKLLAEQLHRWGCRSVAVANDGVEAKLTLTQPVKISSPAWAHENLVIICKRSHRNISCFCKLSNHFSPELNPTAILWKQERYFFQKFSTWAKDGLTDNVNQLIEVYGSDFKVSSRDYL